MAMSYPPVPNHVRHSAPHHRHTHPQLVSRDGGQHPPHSLPPHIPSSHSPPSVAKLPAQHSESSIATLQNARYRQHDIPHSEHSNEDRHFKMEMDTFKAYGVFDGHDGPRGAGFASNFFMECFNSDSWYSLTLLPATEQKEKIPEALREFFRVAEKEFFKSLRHVIDERKQLQRTIPADMNSYQAYLTYPVEVARLQELEPKIAGGSTVVLAVVCRNYLYIANAGDSRAVLVNENEKGLQQILQLSDDHGVENVDELHRLVSLGLDRNQLERSGRLGSQENTRSIGDYSIKEGYKDVDTLRHCSQQPGLCDPHIEVVPITPHCKYIMLMTDGVYKSIEATFEEKASIETNKVLMNMVNHEKEQLAARKRFNILSDRVIDRIRAIHEDAYKKHASVDVRSPIAVSCRKRDDMTLLIHQFERVTTTYV